MENQRQVVEALMQPETYDEPPGHIERVQTHISFVFLTEKFAYKVKKAVNLGFLDFTTLEKRRFFCEKELELNRRLCEGMYLAVVPINKSENIKIRGKGETIEYAVKMKRISQEKMLSRLLENNSVSTGLVDQIAKIIADFHSKAETNDEIREFGSVATIEANWKENYDQTLKFVGATISKNDFTTIRERVTDFLTRNVSLFQKRQAEGKIRDCHGDIHSGNIFVADKIYIFDAIEFNERFRYSDVASDVAFLAMDLDFKKRVDLSDFFIKKYVDYSGDGEVRALLTFYKCYRGFVRGKVTSFKLDDPNIGEEEKRAAAECAQEYFNLAVDYARKL